MLLQVLASVMFQKDFELAENMNLPGDSIFVNQADYEKIEEKQINKYSCIMLSNCERGIGKSRNQALSKATADYILFADSDIRYYDDCRQKVLDAFKRHPKWDVLVFDLDREGTSSPYTIQKERRVNRWNYQKYGAPHIAVRRQKLEACKIRFSLEFGGGAPYSCGEDSIFLHDCMKSGMKVGTIPVSIGIMAESESTWFHGYTEKFFVDRGRLYWELNGVFSGFMNLRFALKKRNCCNFSVLKMYRLMKKGSDLQRRAKVGANGIFIKS